jgi:hypothetical protein
MFTTICRTGAVGAASRYGSGSDQMMRLLAAPAPQHCVDVMDLEVDARLVDMTDIQEFLDSTGLNILGMCG